MLAAGTRTTWIDAISFGLVHIPIELRSATAQTSASFKWIDSESNSAVGNKHFSKATVEGVVTANIFKGIEVEDGVFFTLSKEEIRTALPKKAQTIEFEAFMAAGSVPTSYFDRPYHVSPPGKGHKACRLLCATLVKTGKVGLAKVVISTKQPQQSGANRETPAGPVKPRKPPCPSPVMAAFVTLSSRQYPAWSLCLAGSVRGRNTKHQHGIP